MRRSCGGALLVLTVLAPGLASAEEPKAPTAKAVCARLAETQRAAAELHQRYRIHKSVDGKVVKEGRLEVHRSRGVTALWIEGGGGLGEEKVFVADAYGARVVGAGRVAARMAGPADLEAIGRPLRLARDRLRRRWSLGDEPDPPVSWVVAAGLAQSPEGVVSLETRLGFGRREVDLLPWIDLVDATVEAPPDSDTVRFTRKNVQVEVRRRDGLVSRWLVRQAEIRTVTVVEAVEGAQTQEMWEERIQKARALDASTAPYVSLEQLLPITYGTLPAVMLSHVLQGLAERVPRFWSDVERLQKALDELIPAYLQARFSMDDPVPYELEALVLDVRKPFESMAAEDEPRGPERAAVLALLEQSLLSRAEVRKPAPEDGR